MTQDHHPMAFLHWYYYPSISDLVHSVDLISFILYAALLGIILYHVPVMRQVKHKLTNTPHLFS